MASPYRIIGDGDTVLGFRFAGVDGAVATDRAAALDAFQSALKAPDVVVLILTEAVAAMLDAEVTAHRFSGEKPYIATIQDVWGRHQDHKGLDQLIFEAVGVKLS